MVVRGDPAIGGLHSGGGGVWARFVGFFAHKNCYTEPRCERVKKRIEVDTNNLRYTVSRNDQARTAACRLRTATAIFNENYNTDSHLNKDHPFNLTFHLIHPRNVLTTGNRLSVGVAEAVRKGKLTQDGVEWAITSEKAARRILLKLDLPFTKYDGTNDVGDSFAKLHFWVERHSLLGVKFHQYNIDFFTNFLLQ